MANTGTNTGTKEWAVANVNCWLGCEHRCRYCYAQANAKQYGRIKTAQEWGTTYNRPNANPMAGASRLYHGPVMFPSSHDITPDNIDVCLRALRSLLVVDNQVLIVSKPHAECVELLCEKLWRYRKLILFRFTIGSMDADEAAYWEPGAPPPAERLYCLAYAVYHGFRTSVSCEPLLTQDYWRLIDAVDPYTTGTIWIGMMNRIRSCVVKGTSEEEIARIEQLQHPDVVRCIYEDLKDHPKIRWKDSYKKALGLELVTEPGLDL